MKKMLLALSLVFATGFSQYNLITYDSVTTDLGTAVSLEGVEQVVQDANGVYWFSSGNNGYNGLIAFDGDRWFEYSEKSIPPIGSKVNAIAIDVNGELWAAGTDMVHFNGLEWRTYNINKNLQECNGAAVGVGFTHHWATDIDFDSEGLCYVSSEGVGGFTIANENFSWIGHNGYKTYRANTDVEVIKDTAYFLHRWLWHNGLRKVVDGKEVDIRMIPYSEDGNPANVDTISLNLVLDLKTNPVTEEPVVVRKIDSTKVEIIEKSGDYWIHRDFYTVTEFNKIELNSDGDVWVLADGYLQSKRANHTVYIVPEQTPGLKGSVENFFLSSDGTLWICTKGNGVTRATPSETPVTAETMHSAARTTLRVTDKNLLLNVSQKGHYRIELLSVNGRVVDILFEGELAEGMQNISFDRSRHSAGVYLLRCSGASNKRVRVLL